MLWTVAGSCVYHWLWCWLNISFKCFLASKQSLPCILTFIELSGYLSFFISSHLYMSFFIYFSLSTLLLFSCLPSSNESRCITCLCQIMFSGCFGVCQLGSLVEGQLPCVCWVVRACTFSTRCVCNSLSSLFTSPAAPQTNGYFPCQACLPPIRGRGALRR